MEWAGQGREGQQRQRHESSSSRRRSSAVAPHAHPHAYVVRAPACSAPLLLHPLCPTRTTLTLPAARSFPLPIRPLQRLSVCLCTDAANDAGAAAAGALIVMMRLGEWTSECESWTEGDGGGRSDRQTEAEQCSRRGAAFVFFSLLRFSFKPSASVHCGDPNRLATTYSSATPSNHATARRIC